jgi:prevent-host-death family protein
MHTVGVFEARNRLPALLGEVEAGAEITITRRGRPIARLVAHERGFDRAKAAAMAAGLREASRGVTLGGRTIKSLVEEGRR